ncbi:MAG TPA: efflux RND transporter periplasmic adaptor subunit [Bdellovibrionota bacterium]|jgi:HlyD family secretion protein|nr:efflux RND transporter periplasmic adaptor subunit [Bdellovibrionota bacterium]
MSEKTEKKLNKKAVIPVVLLVAAVIAIKVFVFPAPFIYAGTLEATKVDLSAQLPSTIAEVKVREGDKVEVGAELVRLSCENIKVAADLASTAFERTQRLFKAGTVSQDTMDQVRNRKQESDVQVGWCSIKSPIQGTVLSRYHEPGEWVSPGIKLISLANIKDIWAMIYVPQPEVSRLKVGQKLRGTLPELNDRPFDGTIVKINEEAEFTPKNVQTRAERTRLVFGVKVSFLGANDAEVLKPGMTIETTLPKD